MSKTLLDNPRLSTRDSPTLDSSLDSKPILIIQTGFLGDAVLATGMLRSLHQLRPDIELGFLVRSGVGELFAGHPAIARLHQLDKKREGATGVMAAELREAGYGTALLSHRSLRSTLLCLRAGIPKRIGFRQSDAPILLTRRVDYNPARHELDRNSDLIEALGIRVPEESRASWLTVSEENATSMRRRYALRGSVVLIAPGSVWPTKRWTPEGYAGLAQSIAQNSETDVYLIGSASERDLCASILAMAGLPPEVNLAGQMSLPELAVLISISRRVYTNDSAPLHIAESLGVPVTAIFGPTVPEFGFGPRLEASTAIGLSGLACRPCRIHGSNECPIGTHECMTGVESRRVESRRVGESRVGSRESGEGDA